MTTGKKIQVDDTRLGVWISGASVHTPVEFSIAIVDLAREHGFTINDQQWEEDRPIFTTGEPTFEMVEDLGIITDVALEYLNDNLTEGYFFDFSDGLSLFREPAGTDIQDQ